MGILGRFFIGIKMGFSGDIFLAEFVLDIISDSRQGLLGNPGGIGPHIGDQTDQSLIPHLDPFIEFLGQKHGLFGRKTQFSKGLLLHLAGGKRR